MAKGQQDLKLTSKAEGFDETAKKVDQVTDAQAKLKGQVDKGGKAATGAAKSQEKLSASESDYIGILTQLNPALGALVDGLLKSGKVAGDLASQNINLGDAFKKATAAIKGNANALKLIGAAGAVVLAIFAIVKAIEKMKQEAEAATKALKAQTAALNELQNQRRERGQAIEDVSDLRRIGGFDAETSRRATSTARAIGEQFEFLKPEAINRVIGLAFDAGLSKQQLAQAAFLQQTPGRLNLNENMSTEGFKRAIEGAIRRHPDAIAKAFGRETAQGQRFGVSGERAEQARKEIVQEGGETGAIEATIRQFAPAGADIEKLSAAIRGAKASGVFQQEGPNRLTQQRAFGGEVLTLAEISVVENVLRQIDNSSASGGVRNVTIINQHNGKYMGVGAQGRRRRSRREIIEP